MQGLCLTQQLAQSHALSLSLDQVQQIALSTSLLRYRVSPGGQTNPGNPEELLVKIFRSIVEATDNSIPGLRQSLESFFQNTTLAKSILSQRDMLAVATSQKLVDFCIRFVFDSCTETGVFIHSLGHDGTKPLNPPKTTALKFTSAYRDAEKFRGEITELKDLARKNGARQGAMDELREMQDALNVMDILRPHLDSATLLLKYAFTRCNKQGSLLGNFIRDSAILDRLDLILSENLLKRFVKRCERIGPRGMAVYFEESMLNTMGEYTLMSMGIIKPNIFTRQRGELSESYAHAVKELSSLGIPAHTLLSYYNLKDSGRLFWYRYHLKNVRSDKIADDKIRHFITETLRKDRKAILEAINYQELFPKLKEISTDKDEESREALVELLNETLADDSFQDSFLILLRKWYVTFEQFL